VSKTGASVALGGTSQKLRIEDVLGLPYAIPPSSPSNRQPNCDFYQCNRCDKIHIPKKDTALHLQACLRFNRCRPCRRIYPIDSFNEHRLSCIFRVCYDCGQRRIPAQEVQKRWNICQYVRCHMRRERVPKDEMIHVCRSVRCSRCYLKVPLDEHPEYESNCNSSSATAVVRDSRIQLLSESTSPPTLGHSAGLLTVLMLAMYPRLCSITEPSFLDLCLFVAS
jgi:hypothetical protein